MVDKSTRRPTILWAILAVALVLRLIAVFSQDGHVIYEQKSADSGWYLVNGYALVNGWYDAQVSLPGSPDIVTPVYLPNVPTAPLYLILVGIPQGLLAPDAAIVVVRLLQVAMSVATVYFVYGMTAAISRKESAGLLAAGIIAIAPVFVLETAQILTETTYVFCICAGLWAYVRFVEQDSRRYRLLVLAGGFLGLAVLTRAVLLLFPLGLVIHLLIISGWRRSIQHSIVLMGVYAGVVLIWTVFNLLMWNQRVIGAQGFAAFLYIGSSDSGWNGPSQVDAALAQEAGGQLPTDPNQQQQLYQDSAAANITGNFSGWLSHRVSKLSGAYLQPHGTTFFPGESLKDLATKWVSNDRTISGLIRLTQGEAFWPKLVLYVFHFTALLGGLIGMWLTRRNWRLTLPLIGFIVYTSLIHFVLDASPRYLFPMEAIWWVFAAAALSTLGWRNPLAKLLQRRQTAIDEGVGVTQNVARS